MTPDLSVLPLSLMPAESGAQPCALPGLNAASAHALMQLARQRGAEGRGDDAVCLYRAILALLPERSAADASADPSTNALHTAVRLDLGRTFLHFDRHEEALEVVEEAETRMRPLGEWSVRQSLDTLKALALAGLGRGEEALTLLQRLVSDQASAPSAAAFEVATAFSVATDATNATVATHAEARALTPASRLPIPTPMPLPLAFARVLLAMHRPLEALQALENVQYGGPGTTEDAGGNALDAWDQVVHSDILLTTAAIRLALHQPTQALIVLDALLAVQPEHLSAHLLYGQAATALGEFAFAVNCFERVLAKPGAALRALAYRYMASALVMQGLDDEALACLRAARDLKHDWPAAWLDEAGIRLRRGELAKGFEAYEWRNDARFARRHGAIYWSGDTSLQGQTLLVVAEQGLGDTLQFVRYMPALALLAKRVIVEVQAPLYRLIAARAAAWGVDVLKRGDPSPACERVTLLMSVPHALRTRLDTIPADIPYLGLPTSSVAKSDAKPDAAVSEKPHLRVGIVPSGNPEYQNDAMRSLPLAAFAPLFTVPGLEAVLLTPTPREADRAWLAENATCIHAGLSSVAQRNGDFADTSAYLADVDLVISVDTAMAHLAGAMGKAVWILLPHIADWRWLMDREDSPWYPSAKLFRQHSNGDWAGVMRDVTDALHEMLGQPETAQLPALPQ